MRGRGVEEVAAMAHRQPTKFGSKAIVERWREVAPNRPLLQLVKRPPEARWALRPVPVEVHRPN